MATPGYAALYRVPGAQQSGSQDKPIDNVVGEEKAPTMGLYSPGTPMEVQSPGQPQRLFDPSRARYAAGGLSSALDEKIVDDPGYRAYEDGGMVIPELQGAQDTGRDTLVMDASDGSSTDENDQIDLEDQTSGVATSTVTGSSSGTATKVLTGITVAAS